MMVLGDCRKCGPAAGKRSPSRPRRPSSTACPQRQYGLAPLRRSFPWATSRPRSTGFAWAGYDHVRVRFRAGPHRMSDEAKAEKFLELFNKGKEFTEELLRENQRLRYRVAELETEQSGLTDDELQR